MKKSRKENLLVTKSMLCKLLFIFCFLFFILGNTSGQSTSGEIEKTWVEFDVYEGGEKGMKIHVKFSAKGMLYKQGTCNVWFYYSDGSKLKNSNNRYGTTDGQVAVHDNFKPGYENAVYNDYKLFIPYDELHLGKGKHNLKFYVGIHDNNKKQIAESDFYHFEFTNSSTTTNKQTNTTKTTTNYNDQNSVTTYENKDGSTTMIMKMSCGLCAGTGQQNCSCCMGTGQQRQVNYYTYQFYYIICPCCGGQRKTSCIYCLGQGYTTSTSTYFPDTPINSTVPINSVNSFNTPSNTTKSTRTCPGCNGSGKGMDKITYSPNYTGGNNDRYCSQCGTTKAAHTHHAATCTVCRGKGYVE
ncbi:hypothetical protein LJB98_04000 [Bacteroidales bacterium OttesenSCG-928-M11]|nr:hypothetical protein [Bacteroidales bacterium OttesenSCG-928-M11]